MHDAEVATTLAISTLWANYGILPPGLQQSGFSMDRIRLRPTAIELETGDAHLPEMIRYIEALITVVDPAAAVRNAALAYMALVTAFSEGNVTQIAWAPSFVIELDSQEYEDCALTVTIRANTTA
jgi:hypothetical protein